MKRKLIVFNLFLGLLLLFPATVIPASAQSDSPVAVWTL